jgi:SRSO17 transposase
MTQGLLSDLKRKSIEPIAMAFEGVDCVRNLTNFMSTSKWDEQGMLTGYREELSETLGDPGGMITGDETGFPKKGKESVGVARQYCGRLGKVDNCQIGVMAGYVGGNGYGLIDYGLYMPKAWFEGEHSERRKKSGVPASAKFRTKNEMLLKMIHDAVGSGLFPAKYVGVDGAYGSDGGFLDSLPENLIYFADVRSDCLVFAGRPDTAVPPYSGKGKKPSKEKPEFAPLPVKEIVLRSETPWNKVVLGIGSKGPVISEDKCFPVVEARGGLPGKDVWLTNIQELSHQI